jgi:hypothetical protein
VPLLLLLGAFGIPQPYSNPIISFAIFPTQLMPFLKNKPMLHEWTLWVFNRETPNYAPITIVILIIFWFFAAMVIFYLVRAILLKLRA